jgi:hypothetical protein
MATLFVNKSESRCGACNGGADPTEESHITLTGWRAVNDRMQGCGVEFTDVSSDYVNFPGLYDAIKAMRPDLSFHEPLHGEA